MRTTKSVFTQTVLAASLMATYGTVWAAEDSEVDELTKPSSTVSVGVGAWDNDRAKLGVFDGMRKKDTYLLLDADIQKRDDATGTWQTLTIKDLGTNNREIRGEYLQQGKHGVSIEYNQFRSDAPYTINTNITGIGTTTQTLGANIPNTAIGSGTNYQFGTDRTKLGVGVYKNIIPNVDLNIKFSNEDKKGNRLTNNGSAFFVADLIDWTTTKTEATLDFTGESLQVSGGYYGSWYRNNNRKGYVDAAGGNQITQPLDNQAHQAFFSGSYGFTPTTKGTFKLAYSQATQDAALPTASIINATYANIPNLQGRVDTTLMQLGLTAKPMSKLSLVANLGFNHVEDKTPVYGVVRSTDNTANLTINSTPLSYKTVTGKLEGTYILPLGYSATAGIDDRQQDRTVITAIGGVAYAPYVPSRDKVIETTYRVQLRKSLAETLNGSLAYLQSIRRGSDYQLVPARVGTSTVSPVNSADRDRQKVRLAMDWAPLEEVGVQLNVETAKDKYGDNVRSQGLQEGNANMYSLDVSYQLSDDWLLAGWYSFNTNDARFNNYVSATNNGLKSQNDTGDAIGLNLNGKISAKTTIGAEVTWSKDKTVFVQSNSNGAALTAVAPDITSEAIRLNLFANYDLQKNAGLRFDVGYQKWETNDWQWTYTDGKPFQYGTTTDGTTILMSPKQEAIFASVRYDYKFK